MRLCSACSEDARLAEAPALQFDLEECTPSNEVELIVIVRLMVIVIVMVIVTIIVMKIVTEMVY